jgi:hypothetical protein
MRTEETTEKRENQGTQRKAKQPTKKHGENQIYEIEKAEHGNYGEGIS